LIDPAIFANERSGIVPPEIDSEKCVGCGKCVDLCPMDVFSGTPGFGKIKGEKAVVSHPEFCWHCNCCVDVCPVKGAVSVRTPLSMFIAYK
jgi:NAD-dependent dihydropyrimidine dehydrogenase PreA subunit